MKVSKTVGYCWRTHVNSQADVSARDVPGSSGFKEAVGGVKFTAFRSSPTVSGRLGTTSGLPRAGIRPGRIGGG
jgi:hypothetical protein